MAGRRHDDRGEGTSDVTHDRERWVVLRRAVADGVVGGPDDRSTAQDAGTSLFEVSCSCDHGALTFEVEITSFVELIAAMNVLAARHAREFSCQCVETDEAIARRAVAIWRAEYGTDPVIPMLPGDDR